MYIIYCYTKIDYIICNCTVLVDLPVIQVREWIRDKTHMYKHYHLVKAEPLGWGVPTVHRLWFG